jgi:hypothetical protein
MAALAIAVAASPVLAGGAKPRPDGWVRYYSFQSQFGTYVEPTSWKGNDIYNTTGRYQTSKQFAAGVYEPGDFYVFQVTIENDGPAGRFRVGATGTGNWMVRYQRGNTNITSAVVNGTYETPVLDDNRHVLKVKVWVGNAGTSMQRLLTITSVSDPTRKDAVRIRASYTSCSC